MNEKKLITTKPSPIEFSNQKEAVTRYLFIFLIALTLETITISLNIITFVLLYTSFRQHNIQYSNWFIATSMIPIILFSTALTLYILPIIPRKKTNTNEELMRGRDFIKITKELYNPTTIGYKINGYFRAISLLLGIPIFIANIVLILVGLFIFLTP
ncbi:MAG: hypothetical protein JXA54_11795 [Candidatus Heimdallarchaeota archaeon]|nr:hypothetical protein [Candidatus Heimdallarchaeota archaeon]